MSRNDDIVCPCGVAFGVWHVCAYGMRATGKSWLCPYCNEMAYEGDMRSMHDDCNNVCHRACLEKERRIAARMARA